MKLGTTEISGLYLGSNEIKKAYLGTNKVYEKISEIYFDDTISPISWTEVTARQAYTATNTLGTWVIKAESSYNTTNIPPNAFSSSTTSYWRPTALGGADTYTYLELDCPVYIKPIGLRIRQRYCGSVAYRSYLQGYNENTSSWETLGTLTRSSSATNDDFTLSGNIYYKKFRLFLSRFSGSYTTPYIYLFNLYEGYYKL